MWRGVVLEGGAVRSNHMGDGVRWVMYEGGMNGCEDSKVWGSVYMLRRLDIAACRMQSPSCGSQRALYQLDIAPHKSIESRNTLARSPPREEAGVALAGAGRGVAGSLFYVHD